ncbi:COL12 protein, partial [Polypterus senegalus]
MLDGKITKLIVSDVRFPTSLEHHGSDAMHSDPDYSAAYVVLETDAENGFKGCGLTFTLGRGTEIVVCAVKALSPLVLGKRFGDIVNDFRGFYRLLTSDGQMRWIGPEKGVIHLATSAVLNAVWDLWAKMEGKMIDANQRWNVDEAIKWVLSLAEFKPLWIEEPTSPDDILGHATISKALAHLGIGVATGEQCHNKVIFKQLLQAKAVQFVQIDSCRLGSVNENISVLLMANKFKGIQEGAQCTKCKNNWALKSAVVLLYILCALLTITVAILGYKVVQKMDSVTEGMETSHRLYSEKLTAVEGDLKKLDNQAGEKSENTNSELSGFKSKIQTLQQQLSDVAEKATQNKATLDKLQDAGQSMENSHSSLQTLLDSNTNMIKTVNRTLLTYSSYINNLQEDTTRLQTDLQGQVQVQSQAIVNINSLNLTQAQQRNLISVLQKSVDDTSQAIQKIKNDFQSLQQTVLLARKETDWLKEKVQNLQALAANNSALAKANNDTLEDMNIQLSTLSNQMSNMSVMTDTHDQSLHQLLEHQRDYDNRTASKFDQFEQRMDVAERDIDSIISNISYTAQHLRSLTINLNDVRTYCSGTLSKHADDLLNLNSSLVDIRVDTTGLRVQQDVLRSRLDIEVANLSMIMEEMKLVDTKHSQLITNFTILQATECPAQWIGFRSKCYYFSTEGQMFEEAKKLCGEKSSTMVIINDKDEQQWVKKQVSGKGYFWIGLTDQEKENEWKWIDGTTPTYVNWKEGQPDNWSHGHEHGEDCAGLIHGGLWNDFFCDDINKVICEKDNDKGEQVIMDPIEDDPSKVLTQQRKQCYPPVVATIQAITLPFPDCDDKSRFPVSWDDTSLPNGSKDCLQCQEDSITTSLEKFTPDTTDTGSLIPTAVSPPVQSV